MNRMNNILSFKREFMDITCETEGINYIIAVYYNIILI